MKQHTHTQKKTVLGIPHHSHKEYTKKFLVQASCLKSMTVKKKLLHKLLKACLKSKTVKSKTIAENIKGGILLPYNIQGVNSRAI